MTSMFRSAAASAFAVAFLVFLAGCERARAAGGHPAPTPPVSQAVTAPAPEGCSLRIAAALVTPALPGAPSFDQARREFLGRVRAEPMIFLREPGAPTSDTLPEALRPSLALLQRGTPGGRVVQVLKRHAREPSVLRSLLLREGYLYAPDPQDALALATELHVGDLFDEPEVWHQRGTEISRLTLKRVRGARVYVYAEGSRAGQNAELIFGDRVASTRAELEAPLHRDLRALAEAEGFDRARILHRGEHGLVAELRFGERWVRAWLPSEGARLSLGCTEDDRSVAAHREATQARREALARLSAVVTAQVDEALRFDRPEGEKTAERDGQLRPAWFAAYLRGDSTFQVDGHSYPVFDASGRPWPPQVCVDFVLDSFERASGTWFAPRGEAPGRRLGSVRLDSLGIPNRRGVLGFEKFAVSRPDLFEVRRFQGAERIPFEQRSAFFRFLEENADLFRPGDILAIQGRKRDGRIHQHAILLERTDPVTGFPYGLADQMKRPRRRTFEGIMAEAPQRSLLYRIRPADALLGLGGGLRKEP
ncbi:MAG: hypothetical protein RMJ98_05050 [Myxococcales bacterium]|nr:hypothetical protein [Polyangiaceae bacterium]MDW8248656.1 hypothetical protein [Myxococcales bacterium]